jgi:protein-S-isoprenylcysteine O-methyltransferase Ste14
VWDATLGRLVGIVFGIATQLLFLWTVGKLFWFLRFGGNTPPTQQGVWSDLALAMAFVLPHSVLLVPSVQRFLKKFIPVGLLGCLHCCVTCFTLLAIFRWWVSNEFMLWQASGVIKYLILVGFYSSWVALIYSISLTGFGYQTGLTQWWYWLQRRPAPRRQFVIQGAYRWMRHPIYMSFLGLIWFTPTMSLDHVILTVVWTIYIYAGSYFKDQRMLQYIGEAYREYAKSVPGLPLIGFGPLMKLRA